MSTISLGRYGTLRNSEDYGGCNDAPTPIGAVDVDLDADSNPPTHTAAVLTATLDRIEQIHALAEEYLRQHAAEDFARAHPLQEPSLQFSQSVSPGAFTIFYSGADPDDTKIYEIEFRDFLPFDLTIGD